MQLRFCDGDAVRWAERVAALGGDEHGMLGAARPGRRGDPLGARGAAGPDAPGGRLVARFGAPLHAHLSEQPAENEACLAAYGLTPARLLDARRALGPRSTVVHATHLDRR